MNDGGGVLGVDVSPVDYDEVLTRVLDAARRRTPLSVSALAVHGLMEAVRNADLRSRINAMDVVTPDGQPVRWAMNLLHHSGLRDRVYGPELTRRLLAACEAEDLSVFFYGSTPEVVARVRAAVEARHPRLRVVGALPSRFRPGSAEEVAALGASIERARPGVVFIGLGCPRQEILTVALHDLVSCPVLAVGAAFDYLAGTVDEPPMWIQRAGLQWLWRLVQDPKRLWRRYVLLGPPFIGGVFAEYAWRRLQDEDARLPSAIPM